MKQRENQLIVVITAMQEIIGVGMGVGGTGGVKRRNGARTSDSS